MKRNVGLILGVLMLCVLAGCITVNNKPEPQNSVIFTTDVEYYEPVFNY
jgi:hypothetical protein